MTYRVKISERADADLRGIYEYIAFHLRSARNAANQLERLEKAIALCLYCMKTQVFNDGNKWAAVIFANHYMISQGAGMIIIPEKEVPEFKKLLVAYYEGTGVDEIMGFMREKCVKTL